jgi:ATP-dependent Zn protease
VKARIADTRMIQTLKMSLMNDPNTSPDETSVTSDSAEPQQLTDSQPTAPSAEDIATAYHEAGHAIVALSLGRSVEKLSIVRNSIRLGVVQLGKGRNGRKQDYFETEALILLGGLVSEARYTGHYNWGGAQQDLRSLRRLSLARVDTEAKAERLERRLLDKTSHHLDQDGHWEAVEAVAAELIKSKLISGRAARHLFEECMRRVD